MNNFRHEYMLNVLPRTVEDFTNQYQCEFISTIEELTIKEAEDIYNINIDRESVGLDNGIMFNKIAIKFDNHKGNYKTVSYLPSNSSCDKKYDYMIYLKL